MLSLNLITLTLGHKKLFREISVSFLPSSIIYLNGPNGSGKTSLLRIIAGIQDPDSSGFLTFSKSNIIIENLKKPYCLYIGHNIAIKLELTVFDNIRFWADIYDSAESIEAAIYYFSLQNILDKKCYELSAGNKQKVALAKLLACKANLWLLDEVEANLDEENKKLLNDLIITKANNAGIIIISSHNLTDKIKSAQILDIVGI